MIFVIAEDNDDRQLSDYLPSIVHTVSTVQSSTVHYSWELGVRQLLTRSLILSLSINILKNVSDKQHNKQERTGGACALRVRAAREMMPAYSEIDLFS